MTVADLEKRLKTLREHGFGDAEIQAFDSDSEEWETVTALTYGGNQPVRIYTDEP